MKSFIYFFLIISTLNFNLDTLDTGKATKKLGIDELKKKISLNEISKKVKLLHSKEEKEEMVRWLTKEVNKIKAEIPNNMSDKEIKDHEIDVEADLDFKKKKYMEILVNKSIAELNENDIKMGLFYLNEKENSNNEHHKIQLRKSQAVPLQEINKNTKSAFENENLYPSINKSQKIFEKNNKNDIITAEQDIQYKKEEETLKQVFKRLYSKSDKTKTKVISPLICNNSFLSMFFNTKHEIISILVKQDIRNICPGLIRSCCEKKQLKERFEIIQNTFENVSHSLSNMIKFFEFIEDLDMSVWSKFVKDNFDRAAQCIPNNPMLLIPILKTFVRYSEDYIKIYLWYIQDKLVQILRFQCGMCNFYDNEQFNYDFINKRYSIRLNGKDIQNFLKGHMKTERMAPFFTFAKFFECFQFNWHLTNTQLLNFSTSSIQYRLETFMKDPVKAIKNPEFNVYFRKNFYLFNKNIINWGLLSKTMKHVLDPETRDIEIPAVALVNEEQIMSVTDDKTPFIENNVDLIIEDPSHSEGYINSYNKIDPSHEIYDEFQKSIIDLKKYIEYEYGTGNILKTFLTLFIINLIL